MDVNQVTLNRIRDCAVVNKEDLKAAIYSTDMFTKPGKRRVRYLIGQLIGSNPIASPSTSFLLDGFWVRAGSFPRRLKSIGVDYGGKLTLISTMDSYFGGFASVAQIWSPANLDGRRYAMQRTSRKLHLAGLLRISLPGGYRNTTTEILYLDSDLHISQVCNTDRPEVYLKGEGNGTAYSLPWTSPFRVRQRIAGAMRNVIDSILRRKQQQTPSTAGSGLMLGSVDLYSEAPWQTDENLLELQVGNVESDFSVQDLLQGRVKKRNEQKKDC